jgi:hypothetical protein
MNGSLSNGDATQACLAADVDYHRCIVKDLPMEYGIAYDNGGRPADR